MAARRSTKKPASRRSTKKPAAKKPKKKRGWLRGGLHPSELRDASVKPRKRRKKKPSR